ncbi:terpene synthase family protein [Chitinophaga vietnamensis]|uniref:terpene synthase family protein n=1 Tax=Chitinophaga vietnamensis TaxID=2593957 RepID=UPI001178A211|nr:hypothetical protein [Chitinophaga vietnamensis]
MPNLVHACVTFPGNSDISGFYEDVQQSTLQWAQKFDLAGTPKAVKQLNSAKFGWYAAREYPEASFDEIRMVSDLMTWLFTVDDIVDRASILKDESRTIKKMLSGFMHILDGNEQAGYEHFLNESLKDVLDRFIQVSPPFLYHQFITYMKWYIEECGWEVETQKNGYIPTIGEYMRMRPKTGFHIMFPLVSIFGKIDLPDEVYQHELVQKTELVLNLTACLANDINSLERELHLSTTGFNLVFIFREHLSMSIPAAARMVETQHNDYLDLLDYNRRHMPNFGRRINEQLRKYIDGLFTVIKACYDWSVLDTTRYTQFSA